MIIKTCYEKQQSSHYKTTVSRTSSLSLLIGFIALALLSSCVSSPSMVIPEPIPTPISIYHVDEDLGSDSNSGAPAQPWKTIQKAADTAVAGDIVKVIAGNYTERVNVTRAGITFESDGAIIRGFIISANNVTVKGFYVSEVLGNGIEVSGANCVLENNHIYFPKGWGISLMKESSKCVVKNNKIERSLGSGIEANGTSHIVEGNEIWGTIQVYPGSSNTAGADADGIKFFGFGHVFRNNYIHDIHYGIPENIDPHADCFQTWTDSWHPVANYILFEGNTCINYEAINTGARGQGFMIGTDDGKGGGQNNITIRNNLFVTTRAVNVVNAGIFTITNNTFIAKVVNPTGGTIPPTYSIVLSGSSGNLIKNNIFDVTGSGSGGNPPILGGTSNGNLFFRTDGLKMIGSPAAGDLWGINPLFVNPSAGDYHLQVGSPAIGAGVGGVTFGAYGLSAP